MVFTGEAAGVSGSRFIRRGELIPSTPKLYGFDQSKGENTSSTVISQLVGFGPPDSIFFYREIKPTCSQSISPPSMSSWSPKLPIFNKLHESRKVSHK